MSRLNLGCCLESSFLCIGSYCLTAASDESWFIIADHESREYLRDYCPNSGSVFAQFLENFAAVSYSTGPCRYLLQWMMQGRKRELGVRGQQGSQRFPRSAFAVMEDCQFNLKEHSFMISPLTTLSGCEAAVRTCW